MSSWPLLYRYALPRARPYFSREYMKGLLRLDLSPDASPSTDVLEEKVRRETGWELVRAYGEVPSAEFFALLSRRKFPLVYELREESSLFAAAVPDFWHEVLGHVPFLWSAPMRELYQALGEEACRALSAGDNVRYALISKIYWFSCEYGLLREDGRFKMIGAGLLASPMGPFKLQGRGDVRVKKFNARSIAKEELNPYKFQDSLYYVDALSEITRSFASAGSEKPWFSIRRDFG